MASVSVRAKTADLVHDEPRPAVLLQRLRRASARAGNEIAQQYVWAVATRGTMPDWAVAAACDVLVTWVKTGALDALAAEKQLLVAILALQVEHATILLDALLSILPLDSRDALLAIARQRPNLMGAILRQAPTRIPLVRFLAAAPDRTLRSHFPAHFARAAFSGAAEDDQVVCLELYFAALEDFQADEALLVIEELLLRREKLTRSDDIAYILLEFSLRASSLGLSKVVAAAFRAAHILLGSQNTQLLCCVGAALICSALSSVDICCAVLDKVPDAACLALPLHQLVCVLGPGQLRDTVAARSRACSLLTAIECDDFSSRVLCPRVSLVAALAAAARQTPGHFLDQVAPKLASAHFADVGIILPFVGAFAHMNDASLRASAVTALGSVARRDANQAAMLVSFALAVIATERDAEALSAMLFSLPLFATGPAASVAVLRILRGFASNAGLRPTVIRVLMTLVATRGEGFSLLHVLLHKTLAEENGPAAARIVAARTVHQLLADRATALVKPLLAMVITFVPRERDQFVRAALLDGLVECCAMELVGSLAAWSHVVDRSDLLKDARVPVRAAICRLGEAILADTADLAHRLEGGQVLSPNALRLLDIRAAAMRVLVQTASQGNPSQAHVAAALVALAGVSQRTVEADGVTLVDGLAHDAALVVGQLGHESTPALRPAEEEATAAFLHAAAAFEASHARRGPASGHVSRRAAPPAGPLVETEAFLATAAQRATSSAQRAAMTGALAFCRTSLAASWLQDSLAAEMPSEPWLMRTACEGWSRLFTAHFSATDDEGNVREMLSTLAQMASQRGLSSGRRVAVLFALAGLASAARHRDVPLFYPAESAVDAFLAILEGDDALSEVRSASAIACAVAAACLHSDDATRLPRLLAVLARLHASADDEDCQSAAAIGYGVLTSAHKATGVAPQATFATSGALIAHWQAAALCRSDAPLPDIPSAAAIGKAMSERLPKVLAFLRPLGDALMSPSLSADQLDTLRSTAQMLESLILSSGAHSAALPVFILHAAAVRMSADVNVRFEYAQRWLAVADAADGSSDGVPAWHRLAAVSAAGVVLAIDPLLPPTTTLESVSGAQLQEASAMLTRIVGHATDARTLKVAALMLAKAAVARAALGASRHDEKVATLTALMVKSLARSSHASHRRVLMRALCAAAPRQVDAEAQLLVPALRTSLMSDDEAGAATECVLEHAGTSKAVGELLADLLSAPQPRIFERLDKLVACTPTSEALIARLDAVVRAASTESDCAALLVGFSRAWRAAADARQPVIDALWSATAAFFNGAALHFPQLARRASAVLLPAAPHVPWDGVLARLPDASFSIAAACAVKSSTAADDAVKRKATLVLWDSVARLVDEPNANLAAAARAMAAGLLDDELVSLLDVAARVKQPGRVGALWTATAVERCSAASCAANGERFIGTLAGQMTQFDALHRRLGQAGLQSVDRMLVLQGAARKSAWALPPSDWDAAIFA